MTRSGGATSAGARVEYTQEGHRSEQRDALADSVLSSTSASVARNFQLRIGTHKSRITFDGFLKDDFERLQNLCKQVRPATREARGQRGEES